MEEEYKALEPHKSDNLLGEQEEDWHLYGDQKKESMIIDTNSRMEHFPVPN